MRGRSSATPTLLQVKRCANTAAGTGFPPAKRSIPNSAALRHGSQTTAVSYGATSFIGGCRRETSSGTGAAMVNRRQRPFCAYFPMTATTSLISLTFCLRPQLSQAFRRLYGTAQHRGILAGLAILKLYCECLGTTWTGSPARDPIVFFRTPDRDMTDTRGWKCMPVEFDDRQATAFSFARSPPDRAT